MARYDGNHVKRAFFAHHESYLKHAFLGRYESEFVNPAGALNRVPRYRRILIGLCAGISALFISLFGGVFVYLSIVHWQGGPAWIASCIGAALLIVAFFMALVWLRLWFGSREWIDRAINRVFVKVYVYLMLLVIALLVVATVVMARGK
jgi:hypothetical protein